MSLIPAFWCELDAVVGDGLVDLPVLVAFGLGVADQEEEAGAAHSECGDREAVELGC